MDDIVKAALAKWPHVPDCYGWLGLDARGNWFMRDDACQAAGPFTGSASTAVSRGSLLKHDKLIEFIHRNYESQAGCWFFQNGPQRVYVELEATPWIWRIGPGFSAHTHSGLAGRVQRCIMDEHGRLYLDTELGFGLVHTQDMVLAADAVEQGLWVPAEMAASDLPQRFGYVRSPASSQKAPGK
jgi:hypothetical protein